MLSDMQRAMETYQVTDYEAYMGSTIQLAKNDLFVIDQIRIRTGMDVTVLSNSEHRFLGYQAVASMDGFSDMVKDSAVIVDVGGASLQITLFVHGKIKTTQHIMLGTVYLNENIKRLSHAANYREQTFSDHVQGAGCVLRHLPEGRGCEISDPAGRSHVGAGGTAGALR